jgi:hypothetical protein
MVIFACLLDAVIHLAWIDYSRPYSDSFMGPLPQVYRCVFISVGVWCVLFLFSNSLLLRFQFTTA